MGNPIGLNTAVGVGGVHGLSDLMHRRPGAFTLAPIGVVTCRDADLWMGLQMHKGLVIGFIEIDVHAMGAEIQMVGGKRQNRTRIGLDGADNAPGGSFLWRHDLRGAL